MDTKQFPSSKYQQKENERLFYKTEPKRVLDLIGEEETNRLFSVEDCDVDCTFAICSYVPLDELQKMVTDTFSFHRVVYCEDIISENYPDEFSEFYKAKDSFDER